MDSINESENGKFTAGEVGDSPTRGDKKRPLWGPFNAVGLMRNFCFCFVISSCWWRFAGLFLYLDADCAFNFYFYFYFYFFEAPLALNLKFEMLNLQNPRA